MKVSLKKYTVDAIQFDNNFDEVIEWVRERYKDNFEISFALYEDNSKHPYMKIQMFPIFKLKNEMLDLLCTKTYTIELYDYIINLEPNQLTLVNQICFKELFNEVKYYV